MWDLDLSDNSIVGEGVASLALWGSVVHRACIFVRQEEYLHACERGRIGIDVVIEHRVGIIHRLRTPHCTALGERGRGER